MCQASAQDYHLLSISVPRDPRELMRPRLMVVLVGKEFNQVPVMKKFSVRKLNFSNFFSNKGSRRGLSSSPLHSVEQLNLTQIPPFPLSLPEELKLSSFAPLRPCSFLQAVHSHLIVQKVSYEYKNNLLLAQRKADQECLSFLDLQPLGRLKCSTPLILCEPDLSRSLWHQFINQWLPLKG